MNPDHNAIVGKIVEQISMGFWLGVGYFLFQLASGFIGTKLG